MFCRALFLQSVTPANQFQSFTATSRNRDCMRLVVEKLCYSKEVAGRYRRNNISPQTEATLAVSRNPGTLMVVHKSSPPRSRLRNGSLMFEEQFETFQIPSHG